MAPRSLAAPLLAAVLCVCAGWAQAAPSLLQLGEGYGPDAAAAQIQDIQAQANKQVGAIDTAARQKALAIQQAALDKAKVDLSRNEAKLRTDRLSVELEVNKVERLKAEAKQPNSTVTPAVVREATKKLRAAESKAADVEAQVEEMKGAVDSDKIKEKAEEKAGKTAEAEVAAKSDAAKKAEIMQSAKIMENNIAQAEASRVQQQQKQKAQEVAALSSAKRQVKTAERKATQDSEDGQGEVRMLEKASEHTKENVARGSKSLLKRATAASKAAFDVALRARDLKIAEQEANEVKGLAAGAGEETMHANDLMAKGTHVFKEAKDLQALNEARIHKAEAEISKSKHALAAALAAEATDKQQAEIAASTTRALQQEIKKLSEKKDATAIFGHELRQRAGKESKAAQAGIDKAKNDYTAAQERYNALTSQANALQKKIDTHEMSRRKTVQGILKSIDSDDIGAAISDGEVHEKIDAVIKKIEAEKVHIDADAKSELALMENAKAEENQAMHLQVLANKQTDQAAQNDQVVKDQTRAVEAIKLKHRLHTQKIASMLHAASRNVEAAEKRKAKAYKKYNSCIATAAYIKDVLMAVGKKLRWRAKAKLDKLKEQASLESSLSSSSDKAEEIAKSRLKQAESLETSAAEAIKATKKHLSQVKAQNDNLRQQLAVVKARVSQTDKANAENVAEAQKGQQDAANEIVKGQAAESLKLLLSKKAMAAAKLDAASEQLDSKADELSKAKATNSTTARSYTELQRIFAAESAVADQKAEQTKAAKQLDATNLEVKKAKEAYAEAFGKDAKIPGNKEEAKYVQAKSNADAVGKGARSAVGQP